MAARGLNGMKTSSANYTLAIGDHGRRRVTGEMHDQARKILGRGGRVFGSVPERSAVEDLIGQGAGCDNCGGAGGFVLSVVVGGPLSGPAPGLDPRRPAVSVHGRDLFGPDFDGDQWFLVADEFYGCPVCGALDPATGLQRGPAPVQL